MHPSYILGRGTHQEILKILQKRNYVSLSGVSNETAKALLIAQILSHHPHQAIYLASTRETADLVQHWLSFFECKNIPLLSIDIHTLFLLSQGERAVFVTHRGIWDGNIPSIEGMGREALSFKKGDTVYFTNLIENLLKMGYLHTEDNLLRPGEYRRIGDTLDLFPIQCNTPFRILFHFDHIEHIQRRGKDGVYQSHSDDFSVYPRVFPHDSTLQKHIPPSSTLIVDDQEGIERSSTFSILYFITFPEDGENHIHLRYLSVLRFYTLTDFLNDLRDKLHQQWKLLVVTKRLHELQGILKAEGIPSMEDGEGKIGVVSLFGAGESDILPHSIQNPDLRCALLTDREIFSLRKSHKQRGIRKIALDFITSLSPGDYVVHMEHGIGRFEGVTQKIVDGTTREYLELIYAERDKLFVPVDQADKLSKFVYEEEHEPILTRLGTNEWRKVNEKIHQETEKIARELLELYARRARAKGFSYSSDTVIQHAFEENFSFEETPGQEKAIEEVKRDMEASHPMDRLICGDVGFGKTEVAMRAAFKAVQTGKQVAVLTPITILADQHYHTFQERMAGFPIHIEMLSRFRSPKEQQVILHKLRKGEIDIIIGTHRLLQEDVLFLNLGLVIIDEEQKFGVKQKEKFKDLRASVDILTLTATPIPRTLNLGIHKLRDISIITTPPPGRLPIITEVRKYADELIQQAVRHELKRKGQCFILHNRVETIDAFAEKLHILLPEVRFIVGHGQLSSRELEERILQFKEGSVDVLISSTIIENGIDLPRANTLVVNGAERFGLSQLYQLRGRVGRSNVQAYAYFLYHSQKLHNEAKRRLRAIVEACELGSGFQVAMRDLEIRGAGEILGMSQSGAMQTVGVSHYLRMLKHAVTGLQGGEGEEVEEEMEILLPVEALIPSFYIPDEGERIAMYQKLASAEEDILGEFEEDMREEYGQLPKQVEHLFAILHLKLQCRRSGVTRVKVEDGEGGAQDIVLFLSKWVTAKEIMQLLAIHPQWRISSNTLRIAMENLGKEKEEKWIYRLSQDIALLQKKGRKKVG